MKKLCLVPLFLAAIFMAGIASPCFAESPHDVLIGAGEAMDRGDAVAFQRAVDLDSVIEKTLEAFLEESAKPEYRDLLPQPVVFILSQAADQGYKGQATRGLIASEAKAFVLNGVSSGAFAGKKLNSPSQAGLLAPLFSNVSMGRKEIRGVGDGEADGEDFLLPFYLHDYGNDQDYAVLGRFQPVGDSWKLISIENLPQLFEQLRREALAY